MHHSHSLSATPNASFPASVEARERKDLTLTCEGSALLDVLIDFTLIGVSARKSIGHTEIVSEVTATTRYVARKSITLLAVTTADCGGIVTCTVSTVSGGVTYTSQAAATVQVLGG